MNGPCHSFRDGVDQKSSLGTTQGMAPKAEGSLLNYNRVEVLLYSRSGLSEIIRCRTSWYYGHVAKTLFVVQILRERKIGKEDY